MLDHVFTDAIGALRDSFENALLERQSLEEHFRVDVLLGDLSFETSYGLPGDGRPPRVQVDVSLDWPSWSQTAYRLWYIDDELDDPPRIDIELALRVQRLLDDPDPRSVLDLLPEESPELGTEKLVRSAPTVETLHTHDGVEHAIEVSYEGSYELTQSTLEDPSALDEDFAALGGWIVSLLVKLGDLQYRFAPPVTD